MKRLLIAIGAAAIISAAAWAIGNLETGCAIAALSAMAITLRANWISSDPD